MSPITVSHKTAVQGRSTKINARETTVRDINFKVLKIKDKVKFLKEARGKIPYL